MAFEGVVALVGPIGVGKTPVAEMLSDRLGLEHVILDLADDYRRAVGWRDDEAWQAQASDFYEWLAYEGQFTVPLLEMVVSCPPNAIIDCGGTDLVGGTEEDRQRFRDALTRLGIRVIALLPFEDVDGSVEFLGSRGRAKDIDRALLLNPSYTSLADRVFYTKGGRLEPVADDVEAWLLGVG